MMEEKKKCKPYSFRISDDLMLSVKKKIDKENAKAKTLSERTNLSKKMTELLYDYINQKQ